MSLVYKIQGTNGVRLNRHIIIQPKLGTYHYFSAHTIPPTDSCHPANAYDYLIYLFAN